MTHRDLTDTTPADAEHNGAKIFLRPRTCTIGTLAGRTKYGAVIEMPNHDTFDPEVYWLSRESAIADGQRRINAKLAEGRP